MRALLRSLCQLLQYGVTHQRVFVSRVKHIVSSPHLMIPYLQANTYFARLSNGGKIDSALPMPLVRSVCEFKIEQEFIIGWTRTHCCDIERARQFVVKRKYFRSGIGLSSLKNLSCHFCGWFCENYQFEFSVRAIEVMLINTEGAYRNPDLYNSG